MSCVARNCATMRLASSAHPAPNAEQWLGLPIREHTKHDVALVGRQAAECKHIVSDRIPGQQVPPPPRDIGRLLQVLEEALDRLRYGFHDECAMLAIARQRLEWACSALLRRNARA